MTYEQEYLANLNLLLEAVNKNPLCLPILHETQLILTEKPAPLEAVGKKTLLTTWNG